METKQVAFRKVDEFLAFNLKNLEVFENIKNGDRLQYDTVDKEVIFSALPVNRNSFMGLGWIAQDTAKIVNNHAYGTITDVDEVLKKIVLYFDQLDSLINALPPYLAEMEDTKQKELFYTSHKKELCQVKEKLLHLQSLMKTASVGLMGLCHTASHGKTEENESEGYVWGTINWVRGKEIKNKSPHALSYVHLSLKNEKSRNTITNLLQRVYLLLNESFINIEKDEKITDYSYLNGLFGIVECVKSICTSVVGDGNHLSKQHKWHLFMSLTMQNLENDMGIDLENMLEQLSNCNVNIEPELQNFAALTAKVLINLKAGAKDIDLKDDERACYREFVQLFRNASNCDGYGKIKTGKYKDKPQYKAPQLAFKILRTLNFARFTKNNINAFSEYVLCRLGVEKFSDDDLEIVKKIEQGFVKFPEMGANRLAKTFEKSKAVTKNFDCYAKSNSPHTLGQFEIYSPGKREMKPVTLMRMGCPYVDSTGKINEEYRLFLEECQNRGDKVLYISSQSQHKRYVEGEDHRNLEFIRVMEEDFFGTFFFCVLDNDYGSSLSEIAETDDFIEKQLKRMMENKFYFFPEKVLNSGILKLIQDAAKLMMFGNNPPKTLTRIQQRDFIEQTHALIGIIFPSFFDADRLGVTCKDAIDRAMKMIALMLEILAIAQEQDLEPEVRWLIRVMVHSPAVLIKAQSMNDHVNKLNTARTYLQDSEVKKRIRDRNTFKGLNDIINGSNGLPINYNGEFGFHKLENQRPCEAELNKFALILKEAAQLPKQSNFFQDEYIKDLINSYIDSDYFSSSANFGLQTEIELGLHAVVKHIASNKFKNQDILTDDEMRILSNVVIELFFFAFLEPLGLQNIKSKQFTIEELTIQLSEILSNPKEFLSRIDGLGTYYNKSLSIPQKMFNHCLLNIKDKGLRDKVSSDPLFNAIENSPHIIELMSIGTSLPTNPLLVDVFGKVNDINNVIDMLILGEAAITLMMKNSVIMKGNGANYDLLTDFDDVVTMFTDLTPNEKKQSVRESNLLESASLLKAMRQLIASIAKSDDPYQLELLQHFVPLWNYAMQNVKKVD